MKELRDWFERQSDLEQRSSCLEKAFLHDRFVPYATYRLRFFLPRVLMNWSLHLAGVWLLLRAFTPGQFGTLAIAHLVAAFAGSFWWGSLEEMRGHIRHLYRSGRRGLIPREVGRWLALSLRISAALLIGGTVWGVYRLVVSKAPFGVVEVYLLVIILRLALEIPCRCYHSGLYAIRRIYRPLPAMLAVDVFGFLGLLALWPVLGRWSFPVASFLSCVMLAAVALHYTTRAYRLLGFQPSLRAANGRRLEGRAMAELVAAGFASGIMSFDTLVALAVLSVGAQREDFGILFVVLFAVSPAIRAVGEWAQLFYFDLKRLETAPFGNLTKWLGSRVFRLAWAVGPIFWAIACLATVAVGGSSSRIWLALLPLLHSRSLLSAVQVRYFAEGAYRLLIWTGALCLGGYLMASLLAGGVETLLGLAAVNYCVVVLLTRQRVRRWLLSRRAEPLPPAVWFQEVNRCRSAVQVAVMRYCPDDAKEAWNRNREATQKAARRLAREIARNLSSHGAVTVIHPGRILWFDTAASRTPDVIRQAITRSAGLLELVGQTGTQPSGFAALGHARSAGLFGQVISGVPASSQSAPVRAGAAFLELFPDGIVWIPGGPAASLARLSPNQIRNLIVGASVFARDLFPGRGSEFEVTALCEGDNLRSVFVVCRSGSSSVARRRWRAVIRSINLNAAIGDAAPSSPRPQPLDESVPLGATVMPANLS